EGTSGRKSWTHTIFARELKIACMGRALRVLRCAAAVMCAMAGAAPASANRESDALRSRAAVEIYNMDREQAVATYRQAIAADPEDAAAHRGLASALWLSITFRRGNMTVDDYIGRVTRANTPPEPPPAETAAAFQSAIDKAIDVARRRIAANPRDT